MALDPQSDTDAPVGEADSQASKQLLSRILLTWGELMLVGFIGAALGGATSGPPQLVVYLATTLLSVAALLYNVDRLVQARL
jgi:hypothetical protein